MLLLLTQLKLISAEGINPAATISTSASKDTYVDTYSPGANHGGGSYLYTGIDYLNDLHEAYIYFDFTDKPDDFTKAEISLKIFGVDNTAYINICLIETSWDELTMTWLNKPDKGAHVGQFTIATSDVYTVDVTNLIAGRTSICVCLYTGDYIMDEYVYVYSREYSITSYRPKLTWTYEIGGSNGNGEDDNNGGGGNGTTTLPIELVIGGTIGIIALAGVAIVLLVLMKKKKRQEMREGTRSSQTTPKPANKSQPKASESVIICTSCGKENKSTDLFCVFCGKKMKT